MNNSYMSNFDISRQKDYTDQKFRTGTTHPRLESFTFTPNQEPMQEPKDIPPLPADSLNEFLEDVTFFCSSF